MLEEALKGLALQLEVEVSVLEFIGSSDFTYLNLGVAFYFNIIDPHHESYKSTMVFIIK